MAVTFDEVRELKKTAPQPEGGGPHQESAMRHVRIVKMPSNAIKPLEGLPPFDEVRIGTSDNFWLVVGILGQERVRRYSRYRPHGIGMSHQSGNRTRAERNSSSLYDGCQVFFRLQQRRAYRHLRIRPECRGSIALPPFSRPKP